MTGIFYPIKDTSIHSISVHLEAYKQDVNTHSLHIPGGMQHTLTKDGHKIVPLVICNGLQYLPLRPYTDHELLMFPHVLMTSDDSWDPSLYDDDPNMIHKCVLVMTSDDS